MPGMISIESPGSFKNTDRFLAQMAKEDLFTMLDRYGMMGVNALSSATPRRSGRTANSWKYDIINKKGFHGIIWRNTNVHEGIPIAILIQYGHGTGTGGWVEGFDYINPSIRPLFDKLAEEVWRGVTNG